jgi:hypothetical protein
MGTAKLICTLCGKETDKPGRCEQCGGTLIIRKGETTEQERMWLIKKDFLSLFEPCAKQANNNIESLELSRDGTEIEIHYKSGYTIPVTLTFNGAASIIKDVAKYL